jgi:hypothetical protein
MARQCVFCGSSDLTREHILPDWLTEIGLDLEPSIHHWTAKQAPSPVVRKAICDHGEDGLCRLQQRMAQQLEGVAKPVIGPLILGEGRRLPVDDQALIAAWTCKTALMSLLMSQMRPGHVATARRRVSIWLFTLSGIVWSRCRSAGTGLAPTQAIAAGPRYGSLRS